MMKTVLLGCFAAGLLYVSLFFAFGAGLDIGQGKPKERGQASLTIALLLGVTSLFVAGVVGRDFQAK